MRVDKKASKGTIVVKDDAGSPMWSAKQRAVKGLDLDPLETAVRTICGGGASECVDGIPSAAAASGGAVSSNAVVRRKERQVRLQRQAATLAAAKAPEGATAGVESCRHLHLSA